MEERGVISSVIHLISQRLCCVHALQEVESCDHSDAKDRRLSHPRRKHNQILKLEGSVPSKLSEFAGWYFRVYVRVHLLRRECSTRGSVGWLSAHWIGGEGGGFKKLREVGSPLIYP